jgi:acyl-CoA thioesterase
MRHLTPGGALWLYWPSAAETMANPFAKLIALHVDEFRAGFSKLSLEVTRSHFNPNEVVHGAVIYAMADTGMGAALHPTLDEGQMCATIEIKINYFKPVAAGRLTCVTEMVNRGKTLANLDSRVYLDDVLVAQANGNYAIFVPRKAAP